MEITIEDGRTTSNGVDNLLPGTYKVTEEPAENGTSLTGDNDIEVTVVGGVTSEDNSVAVAEFTNNIDLGGLQITKNVTVNGAATTGTEADGTYTFTVTGPDDYSSTQTITIENGESSTVTIDNLTPGEYTVTEDTSSNPDGMALVDENGKTVTVEGGAEAAVVTVEFTNDKTVVGGLKITKNVTVNGAETAGQEADGTYIFTVRNSAGETAGTVEITIEDGRTTSNGVDNLLPGTYKVTEEPAENGTSLTGDNDIEVTVVGGVTSEDSSVAVAEFTNNIDLGGLRITKNVTVNGVETTGQEADGTYTFTVTGPNDYSSTQTITIENGESNTVTVDGLIPGEYTVTEDTSKNPDGMALVDENGKTVTVAGGANAEIQSVEFTNNKPADVKVFKRQDSIQGALLAGAVLQILDGETVVDEWTTTAAAHDVSDIMLPGKTYTLHEVSAPDGFELAEDITIVVTDEGAITVDGKDTGTITMVDYQEAIYGEQVPVIVNKYDKDTMEELAGAVLTVYDPAGKVIDEGSWTSAVGSNVQFMLSKGSTFTLKEETAPSGYTSVKDITITVSPDGEVSVSGDKDSFKVDASTGEVEVLDTRISMKVEKKDDTGAFVKGAALQILAEDDSAVASWVTDGTAKDVSEYLEAGRKYKLHESVVPYGYKEAADIEFTVTSDGKFKVGDQTMDTLTMIDVRTTIPGGNTSGSGGGGSTGGGNTSGSGGGGNTGGSGSAGSGSGTAVSGGSGTGVKTGDDTPIMLWLMLLFISMGAITAAGMTLKKRRNKEQ